MVVACIWWRIVAVDVAVVVVVEAVVADVDVLVHLVLVRDLVPVGVLALAARPIRAPNRAAAPSLVADDPSQSRQLSRVPVHAHVQSKFKFITIYAY